LIFLLGGDRAGGKGVCGRLMSPVQETQSMGEIRLLRGRLPRKGGGLTGMSLRDLFLSRNIFWYGPQNSFFLLIGIPRWSPSQDKFLTWDHMGKWKHNFSRKPEIWLNPNKYMNNHLTVLCKNIIFGVDQS
jgi:hypothetical protein